MALIVVGVLALGAVALLPQMRHAQLPALNEREFMVVLETKPGTSLTRMKEITSDVTDKLRAVDGVRNVVSHVGRAVTGDQVVDVNNAKLWVSLDAGADREAAVADMEKVVDDYPDLEGDVESYQQARVEEAEAGPEAPVVVRVYGNEQGVLNQKANEVGQELAKIDGIEDLQVHLPAAEPTLEVEVDLEKARVVRRQARRRPAGGGHPAVGHRRRAAVLRPEGVRRRRLGDAGDPGEPGRRPRPAHRDPQRRRRCASTRSPTCASSTRPTSSSARACSAGST